MLGTLSPPDPAWPGVSIVIPTWNGLPLLREYLPSVCQAVEAYPGPCECLIVDDGGTDATATELPGLFPQVRLLRRERNEGFGAAVTAGLAAAVHPWVLLLNNDIRVPADFLRPLAEHFRPEADSKDLFAVVALQINQATNDKINPPVDGCRELRFVRGELALMLPTSPLRKDDPARPTALANGGCTLFSRAKVAALGGLCPLFNPFYYEDAELSVQALRRGWKIVCEPRSIVWHRPNSTTLQHPTPVSVTAVRNAFFFQWMLLDEAAHWVRHLFWILPRVCSRALRGESAQARGFWRALASWRLVRQARAVRGQGASRTLGELLAKSK